ncbi:hypothetical protein EMCRGX_G015112 [Ephydatia muelleri]
MGFETDLDVILALAHLPIHRLCQFMNQTAEGVFHDQDPPIRVPVTECNEWVASLVPHVSLGAAVFALLVVYTCHYLLCVVRPPKVVCSDPAKVKWLEEHCPVFFQSYWPTAWAPQAHMQTILRAVVQTRHALKLHRRREDVIMSDGGHVSIDWYNERSPRQPTVLILPGITGSSDESYAQHWIDDLTHVGYRSVVLNYRGCGSTTLTTPRLYCGCDITDLQQVVEHIMNLLPTSPLMGVAVSMGSMLMIKYITECSRRGLHCPLKAAMLVSVPWNLPIAERNMNKTFNRLTLNRHLCKQFRDILRNNETLFRQHCEQGQLCFDFDKALQCQFLDEMAHTVTLPMFGYRDLAHLYEDGSPHLRTTHLHIPIVAINAADDPFCPEHAIPEDDVLGNNKIALFVTKKGGHIGFLEGLLPSPKNMINKALVQFAVAVLEKGVA